MRKLWVGAVVFLILIALAPDVSAGHNSMFLLVFLRSSDGDDWFKVGDEAEVEILVFDKGELVDPDTNPEVYITNYVSNIRELNVTKQSTGTFNGTFTILEGDLTEGGALIVEAWATLGKESEDDTNYDEEDYSDYIYLNLPRLLDIKFDIDRSFSPVGASQGDYVNIEVMVEYDEEPVNPDNFMLTIDDEPVLYTNPETGRYLVNLTLGPSIPSSSIRIEAEVFYNDERARDWDYIDVSYDHFTLWFREIDYDENYMEFELYVLNREGRAVQGADMELEVRHERGTIDRDFQTDSNGGVRFFFSHQDSEYVNIEGSVEYMNMSENFYRYFELKESSYEPQPSSGFDVLRQNYQEWIREKGDVTLEYIAYKEKIPCTNKEIYYYIYTSDECVDSGSIITDGNGMFTVNLTAVDTLKTYYFWFESPFDSGGSSGVYEPDNDDGMYYHGSWDYAYYYYFGEETLRNESIQIEADNLVIGGESNITVRVPEDSEVLYVNTKVIPGKYDFDSYEEIPERFWIPLSGSDWTFMTSEGDGIYTGTVFLPEFLPKNGTYTIVARFYSENYDINWDYTHVNTTIKIFEPEEPVDPEDDGIVTDVTESASSLNIRWILIIFALIAVPVAITFVFITLMRKREEKGESEEEQKDESEPSSKT